MISQRAKQTYSAMSYLPAFLFVTFAIEAYVFNGVTAQSTEISETTETSETSAPCNYEGNTVWTTDGEGCIIFTNPCWFDLENKNRTSNGADALTEIPEEECKQLCDTQCPNEESDPSCVAWGYKICSLRNECTLQRRRCWDGYPYEQLDGVDGACPTIPLNICYVRKPWQSNSTDESSSTTEAGATITIA